MAHVPNVAVVCCLLLSIDPLVCANDFHEASACEFQIAGSRSNIAALDACVTQLLHLFGIDVQGKGDPKEQRTETCIGVMRGLGSQFAYANSTRNVCWETPNLNLTSVGCEVLNAVAWETMAVALRQLAFCSGATDANLDVASLEHLADETFASVGNVLRRELDLHAFTPLGLLVGGALKQFYEDLTQPLRPEGHNRQLVLRLFAFSRKVFEHANWMIWRDTHYLWLQECLKNGEVVHSAWGDLSRWEELGANDAHSRHALEGAATRAPQYAFVNEGSQRTEILVSLLKQLHQSKGSSGDIVMVEIGVFRAGLSASLLEQLPFLRLVGVDPYIGKDGTFPGDFSDTLDPDAALAQASSIFQGFGERAMLLPMSSKEAAGHLQDAIVDAIFVDGCHLYSCVDDDLKTWMPKLSGPGALIAGHDFSPQWPGVVRAVHEHRIDGQKVFLSMDWTYWWYVG